MDLNDKEIWLLNNDPGKLLSEYQGLIRVIVRGYSIRGFVSDRDSDDLVQEINQELLGRLGKIRVQYNGKSSLKTYFSVIIRNICRERFRKNPGLEEPRSPEYNRLERHTNPRNDLIIMQEYERLEKVLKLMLKDRARFNIMLRFILDLRISKVDLYSFEYLDEGEATGLIDELNGSAGLSKKQIFSKLSEILKILEKRETSPESLRKWFKSRSDEFIRLMNGDPPRSAYSMETIQILIETYDEMKKVD